MSPVRSWSLPPFFCTSAGRGHAVRLFHFHHSGLICKGLCKIRKNGEFSVSSFRRYEIADSPPNSPFALCRGNKNFKSHNQMKRSYLEKSTPFSFRILQRMVVKKSPVQNWRHNIFLLTCNDLHKIGSFGFDDICTMIYSISRVPEPAIATASPLNAKGGRARSRPPMAKNFTQFAKTFSELPNLLLLGRDSGRGLQETVLYSRSGSITPISVKP